MSLGPTLDTAIGIAFVFFLFSSLLTILMEIIAGVLGLRAAALKDAITRLLTNPDSPGWPVIGYFTGMFGAATKAVKRVNDAADGDPTTAAAKAVNVRTELVDVYNAVVNHPLLKGAAGADAPSYVPAANFSAALMQSLAPGGGIAQLTTAINALPDGTSLKAALTALLSQAQGNLATFQAGIETWFDAAMDRLSGGYKRFTQVITFVVGLALAVVVNVDTIHVYQALYSEPATRDSMSAQAAAAVARTPAPAAPQTNDAGATPASNQAAANPVDAIGGEVAQAQTTEGQLWKVGPVGWTDFPPHWNRLTWFWAGIGWLLTALAGLLGAPFWFDALSGLVNIRNAGPKPASSTAAGSQPSQASKT